MPDRDVVISVRHVRKAFPTASGDMINVLNGVTFDIYRGETLVIMGGSGDGKSTLLNCLIGEYEIDHGELLYHTRDMDAAADIHRMTEEQLDAVRKRFGILFQSGALFNSLSVAENVALPLREHSYVDPSIIDIVVTLKLQQVKMLAHREKMPAQLSGGQKKRAGLARATALDPEILFYDEPSAGLDPVTSCAIDELMMDLSRKLRVTSVVVTHEMDSAFRIADRMIMLHEGRTLHIGPRSEFEEFRDRDADKLNTLDQQIMHQFLRGEPHGPLTGGAAADDYERVLLESSQRRKLF